jgi:hypothetical protein
LKFVVEKPGQVLWHVKKTEPKLMLSKEIEHISPGESPELIELPEKKTASTNILPTTQASLKQMYTADLPIGSYHLVHCVARLPLPIPNYYNDYARIAYRETRFKNKSSYFGIQTSVVQTQIFQIKYLNQKHENF